MIFNCRKMFRFEMLEVPVHQMGQSSVEMHGLGPELQSHQSELYFAIFFSLLCSLRLSIATKVPIMSFKQQSVVFPAGSGNATIISIPQHQLLLRILNLPLKASDISLLFVLAIAAAGYLLNQSLRKGSKTQGIVLFRSRKNAEAEPTRNIVEKMKTTDKKKDTSSSD